MVAILVPIGELKWMTGNLKEILDAQSGVGHGNMIKAHGGNLRYGGMFGDDRILITDPAALKHILIKHSYDYPKPDNVRSDLGRILGKGVLFAEGDVHKRQRAILSPAFSPAAIRDLTPTFFELSYKLRDKWQTIVREGVVDERAFKDSATAHAYYAEKPAPGHAVIEVSNWMSKVTLDIIGRTGFGYSFNSLDSAQNDLASAFNALASAGGGGKLTVSRLLVSRVLGAIINYIPVAKYIPNERLQAVRKAFETMEVESTKIIAERRKEVEEAGEGSGSGKDLISLLLKASKSDSAGSHLSDDELMGQCPTFLLAGHETTSTVLSWTLYTLSRFPAVQDKLRAEIRNALAEKSAELTSDELSALPYLDAVCREILRFEPAVSATIRTSTFDDEIPLSTPVTSPTTGKVFTSIPVKAGQVIFLPITAINMQTAIFGDDAAEFRPERWIEGHVGEKQAGVGTFAHMMTFIAGPRSCIGYRFSLVELKAILTVLVDDFTFEEREKDMKIERRSAIVMRPYIVGEEELGGRMPLKVTFAKRD